MKSSFFLLVAFVTSSTYAKNVVCNPGYFGKHCECYSTKLEDQTPNCKADNTSTVDCSGRGSCICGVCECHAQDQQDKVISGEFCECDNFSCDRHEGLMCSGPDHGECVCGKCQCHSSWSSSDTCYSPGDTEICSGLGECICGKCHCNKDEFGNTRYAGEYCDKLATNYYPARCLEYKDCVQCQIFNTGPLSEEECKKQCTIIVPLVVPKLEITDEDNLCIYFDEYDCRFKYAYNFENNYRLRIKVQEEKECPSTSMVFYIQMIIIIPT